MATSSQHQQPPPRSANPEYDFKIGQISTRFGISHDDVIAAIQRGDLHVVTKYQKVKRVTRASLERWLTAIGVLDAAEGDHDAR